jgi:trans-aconitate methyltransferase
MGTGYEGRLMNEKCNSELAEQTQLVYERNAFQFAKERPRELVEQPWLDRFRQLIPKKGSILDLGCGPGAPVTSYFMGLGHPVIGLDASNNMIRIAKRQFPAGDWRVGDMRSFDFSERFHGIIGWNSFFHLTREEQRTVLPNMAMHLQLNGALLLTVGPEDGEVAGKVVDDLVYHASLSPQEYSDILSSHGIEIRKFVAEDPNCYGMTILLAQKTNEFT